MPGTSGWLVCSPCSRAPSRFRVVTRPVTRCLGAFGRIPIGPGKVRAPGRLLGDNSCGCAKTARTGFGCCTVSGSPRLSQGPYPRFWRPQLSFYWFGSVVVRRTGVKIAPSHGGAPASGHVCFRLSELVSSFSPFFGDNSQPGFPGLPFPRIRITETAGLVRLSPKFHLPNHCNQCLAAMPAPFRSDVWTIRIGIRVNLRRPISPHNRFLLTFTFSAVCPPLKTSLGHGGFCEFRPVSLGQIVAQFLGPRLGDNW